ncbi:hypothetical protein [Candidatus Avelusimicrobium alvi]|uniref:hypothetical protein n=1 Tax=Candidatus Avelusimicrobium alvi TaxID=3416221 RepID=UPI003D13A116
MKKEELMKLLRNPAKYRKTKQAARKEAAPEAAAAQAAKKTQDMLLTAVGISVVALVLVTLVVILSAKKRADNLTAALDPEQVKGLAVAEAEFNPNTGVTYVQVQEGQDRNVAVSNLGSTLPIISRFNYKAFTPKNYEIIGAAPWALTTNFASNLTDPDLMRYLLSNDTMIQAFLNRNDVASLLEDPQLLLAFSEDKNAMEEFFESDTIKSVLADEKMVRSVAGSRFMSYLLISKAVKYFRDRPQEAARIIAANPYLKELQQNPHVRVAVLENPYLKKIAPVLLAGSAESAAQPAAGRYERNQLVSASAGSAKAVKK